MGSWEPQPALAAVAWLSLSTDTEGSRRLWAAVQGRLRAAHSTSPSLALWAPQLAAVCGQWGSWVPTFGRRAPHTTLQVPWHGQCHEHGMAWPFCGLTQSVHGRDTRPKPRGAFGYRQELWPLLKRNDKMVWSEPSAAMWLKTKQNKKPWEKF